jgi:hypothetical protein
VALPSRAAISHQPPATRGGGGGQDLYWHVMAPRAGPSGSGLPLASLEKGRAELLLVLVRVHGRTLLLLRRPVLPVRLNVLEHVFADLCTKCILCRVQSVQSV